MPATAQQIFRKIVLHNKLMNEATVDRLLIQMPDPEVAVKFLVKKEKISPKKAEQLLQLYRKQLEKHADRSAGGSQVLTDETARKPATPEDSFDAMFDEILSDKGTGPPATDRQPSPKKEQAVAEKTAPPSESKPTAAPAAVAKKPAQPALADDDDLPVLELDTDETPPAAAGPQPAPAAPQPAAAEEEPPRAPATPAEPARPITPAGPIDPWIKAILTAARGAKASDVHIKSGEVPLMRVAGFLREVEDQQAMEADQCRAALLTLLDSGQRERFVKTGDLDFCYDGGEQLGRFRANMLNQHRGTDGIFRLIATEVPSFEALHLPPTVKKFTEYKQGIVLITGPKGSGKTTTLAAMVDMINRTRPEHIITVEDPIEFVHPCKMGHVNQREVGPHTETFSAALRAALREAPDVIMVGEMRDLETTSLAITAAETGHLVFATLHTPDAIRTIDRVLDVFPPKEQGQIRSMLSESLRGIVSQLLVPSADEKSQQLAVEIMVNTSAIGNLIREAKTFQLRGIMQTGRRLGMILMDDSLGRLVKEGRVTKEAALPLAVETKEFQRVVGSA